MQSPNKFSSFEVSNFSLYKSSRTGDKPHGVGSRTGDKPHGVGSRTGDKPHGVGSRTGDKSHGLGSRTGDKPHGVESRTCLPARETTYTNTGYAATTIL